MLVRCQREHGTAMCWRDIAGDLEMSCIWSATMQRWHGLTDTAAADSKHRCDYPEPHCITELCSLQIVPSYAIVRGSFDPLGFPEKGSALKRTGPMGDTKT